MTKTQSYRKRMGQLGREVKQTDAKVKAELLDHSELHEAVVALRKQQRALMTRIQRAREVSDEALDAALAAYVEKLPKERPTNANMLAFRAQVLLPLNELVELTACSDWDNRLAVQETWERVLGANGDRLETLTNTLGMQLVLIPTGEFLMGSPDSDSEAGSAEKPQHRVQITKPFYLGVYEVTQTQYQKVVGSNPSEFKGESLPVETVSWEDAVAFCQRLSEVAEERVAGRTYRLPTEAEWEYACRAGSTGKYSFGESEAELGKSAWYNKNSGNTTHPVGAKQANAWGLCDMHGNVWEWCQDWYGPYAAGQASDPSGSGAASLRVLRGGSWCDGGRICRSAYRLRIGPGGRNLVIGFRVAGVRSGP
ncbi:MAG: formylglycine-generating enzyme family protein [Planctomycetota bacterium]|nr:formylglycine-generating enzyme family protein [Planctomycetota bacterium]